MKKAITLAVALLLSGEAMARTSLTDLYFAGGYGSNSNLNLEVGTDTRGLGWFGGFNVNLDDELDGPNLDSSFGKFPDVNVVGTGEDELFGFYTGTNYTINHGRFDSSFGIGIDVIFSMEYQNFYDSDRILGDGGHFHSLGDTKSDWGAVLSYRAHFRNVGFGVLYRTHENELVGSLSFRF
ncbi:hypothetical protein ABXV18_26950 [Vibrio owensii]|uniref:hypothetical protein n=1 Tax=Vibrio owensii TaxID=696485 RepID=UPI0033942273